MIDTRKTGERIKKLCREKGIPAKRIMEMMGFTSPNAVYKWFSGKSIPSIDNLLILAEALGTTVEDLIVETDEEEKNSKL